MTNTENIISFGQSHDLLSTIEQLIGVDGGNGMGWGG